MEKIINHKKTRGESTSIHLEHHIHRWQQLHISNFAFDCPKYLILSPRRAESPPSSLCPHTGFFSYFQERLLLKHLI